MLWQVPTSNSYTWGVDFSERNVVSETFGQFMGLTDTIRSEGFSFKLSLEKGITEMTVYLCLSQDRLKTDDCNNVQSPWLRLTLTTSPDAVEHFASRKNDIRNICFAWINERERHCISRLTGGFHGPHGEDFTITNEKFVLYDDVCNKDNLSDYNILLIDCELHAFTFNDRVDSGLVQPPKSVVVDNTDHTLVKDLRRMLDTGQGSDVTLVASDGREFAAHVTIFSSRTLFFAKINPPHI